MSDIQKLVQQGWQYHDTASQRLGNELEALALADLDDALDQDLAAGLLRLANHTIGEHLQDWSRAVNFARQVWQAVPQPVAESNLAIQYALAELLGGDAVVAAQVELATLGLLVAGSESMPNSAAQNADVLALQLQFRLAVCGSLVGSGRVAEGAGLYEGLLAITPTLVANVKLQRALAVSSNNIAGELLTLGSWDQAQSLLMRRCAGVALANWRLCGTWENEERALYLAQMVAHAQADYRGALGFADQALAVIQSQGPEPVDEGFILLAKSASCAALGLAQDALEALAQADALAAQWQDSGLQAAYAEDKRKLQNEQSMLST